MQHRGEPDVGWVGFGGALAAVLGICLIVWPSIGAKTIGILIGLWLILTGLLLLFLAWQRDKLEALAEESPVEVVVVEERIEPLIP